MKKKSDRKLMLSRETLSSLHDEQLNKAAGGATEYPCIDTDILTNYLSCACYTQNGCSLSF